jgi:hypothetical protein
MGIVTTCTPHKRKWRLRVRGKLTKRLQTELRLALYLIDGLRVKEKERLVNGEELRLTVVDAVIGIIDETLPPNVHRRPLHIGAKQTVKEVVHATH